MIPSYTDPADDTHDTGHDQRTDVPSYVDHPDVDLLEYKVSHDDENLYFYFRSRGEIGRTQTSDSGAPAGRYYVIITIDVDDNDDTGYWVHEGGYYPTSRGYDVNAEIEFYDGQFNTGHYLKPRRRGMTRNCFRRFSTRPPASMLREMTARIRTDSCGFSPERTISTRNGSSTKTKQSQSSVTRDRSSPAL